MRGRLVADSYSYKTHVTRDNRSGEMSIAIEGERKGTYAPGTSPEWVTLGDKTVVNLGQGHVVTFGADNFVSYDVPGYGLITAQPSRAKGVNAQLPTTGCARVDQRLQKPDDDHHGRWPSDGHPQPH